MGGGGTRLLPGAPRLPGQGHLPDRPRLLPGRKRRRDPPPLFRVELLGGPRLEPPDAREHRRVGGGLAVLPRPGSPPPRAGGRGRGEPPALVRPLRDARPLPVSGGQRRRSRVEVAPGHPDDPRQPGRDRAVPRGPDPRPRSAGDRRPPRRDRHRLLPGRPRARGHGRPDRVGGIVARGGGGPLHRGLPRHLRPAPGGPRGAAARPVHARGEDRRGRHGRRVPRPPRHAAPAHRRQAAPRGPGAPGIAWSASSARCSSRASSPTRTPSPSSTTAARRTASSTTRWSTSTA